MLGHVDRSIAIVGFAVGVFDFWIEQGKTAHHGQFGGDFTGYAEFQTVVDLFAIFAIDPVPAGEAVRLFDVEQGQRQQGFAHGRLGTDFILLADLWGEHFTGVECVVWRCTPGLQAFHIRCIGRQPRHWLIDKREARRGFALVVAGFLLGR